MSDTENVRITNIDTDVTLIISKEQFQYTRTLLSENTVYQYTNEPITKPNSNIKCNFILYLSNIFGGITNEINRATAI